ncbi:MAG: MG2 domain-containing protein, partial [Candidatus Poribacteria bacterium]|nr:MG2 domain-containing protein [Candidatus Poribacteria bacterium]
MSWNRHKSFGILAVVALVLTAAVGKLQTRESVMPLVLYGSGNELGGHLPLSELTLGDAPELRSALAEHIQQRTELIVTQNAVKWDALSPNKIPALLLASRGANRLTALQSGNLAGYIQAGGFLVALPMDEPASQELRQWLRTTFPNNPLMELSSEQLKPTDAELPESMRSVIGNMFAVDAVRMEGEIRVIIPRNHIADEATVPFATSASMIAALRSPYVRRVAESPIALTARREGNRVVIRAVVREFVDGEALNVALYDMDGRQVRAQSMKRQNNNTELSLEFSADIATVPFDPQRYWARAEWDGIVPLKRTVNLSDLLGVLDTELKGQDTWQAGMSGAMRVIARDAKTQQPIANATVRAELRQGETTLTTTERTTNPAGAADLRFELPDDTVGEAKLVISVITPMGDDRIEQAIRITNARKIMLTTDKPLYQPSQRIHLRAVTLRAGDLKAVGDGTLTFEVEDAKGNKVFKYAASRNEFGVASAEFSLADEVNFGRYTVRVIDGEQQQEKTVTVQKYVLPKFRVATTFNRDDYRPGELVEATVQTDYFFGKPVARGSVEIVASKFDVDWETFAKIQGKTDENGTYKFELDLPSYFTGLPLDRGDSLVRFEITVTDTAEHSETQTATRPVVQQPFMIVLIPESGSLVSGVENELYAVTTTPQGKPVQTTVTLEHGDTTLTTETDALGSATFTYNPSDAPYSPITFKATVRDRQGRSMTRNVEVGNEASSVLLRPDASLVAAGESLGFTVHSTNATGWAYVDVIRAGQTILTKSVQIANHRGAGTLPIGPNDFGTLTLHAYQINPDGEIRRDTRLVYAEPADELAIDVTPDKQVYRPGEDGTIRFHVANKEGHPVLAALGVQVVDESVFAIQEMQPGMERVFFLLEKELLTPRIEV